TGGSGTPGGAEADIQFHEGTAFGGDTEFTWNTTTKTVTLVGAISGVNAEFHTYKGGWSGSQIKSPYITSYIASSTAKAQFAGSSNVRFRFVQSGGTKWVDLTDGGATTLHTHTGIGGAPAGSFTANIGSDYTYGISGMKFVSSQNISGGSIIGNLYYPYDYMIYREGNTYYNRDTKTGVIKRTFASPHGSGLKVVLDDAIDRLTVGGKILIRNGNYKCSGIVTVDYNNITIEGEGRDYTKIWNPSGGFYALNKERLKFKGFTLSGGSNFFLEYGVATPFREINDIHFDNLWIRMVSSQGISERGSFKRQGIVFYVGSTRMINTKITDCIFQETLSHGLCFYGDSGNTGTYSDILQDTLIENCRAIRCGLGPNFIYSPKIGSEGSFSSGFVYTHHPKVINMRISHCFASGCLETGYYMEGYPEIINLVIDSCKAEYCGVQKWIEWGANAANQGWGIAAGGNSKIVNCVTIGNRRVGILAGGAPSAENQRENYALVDGCFVDGNVGYTNYKTTRYGIETSDYVIITNNTICNASSASIHLVGDFNEVTNNTITAYTIPLLGTTSQYSKTVGIDARGTKGSRIEGNLIKGSGAEFTTCYGIQFDSAYDTIVRNNTILNTGYKGIFAGYRSIIENNFISGSHIGYGIHAQNRYENIVRGNRIYNPYYWGIKIQTGGRDTVSNNYIYKSRGIAVEGDNSSIFGNMCINTEWSGIEVSGTCMNIYGNTCIDNQSLKTQSYGIEEKNGCNWNLITNNYVSGTVNSPSILIVGPDTIVNNNPLFHLNKWKSVSSQAISGGSITGEFAPYRQHKIASFGGFWFSANSTNTYGQLYVCSGNTNNWMKVTLGK
ncbi:MAG: right-handed parallel beta-helix repeat-containing protein, partial [Actinobacteria bacterium]|nr:right-handed parallel beta-helix repeat-containing protein [Actinomycetota bacterium]